MTTDTTTTTGLRLVRLSDAYLTGAASPAAARGMREAYNPDNPDTATYFAGPSEYGADWVTVVIPESDPRHAGAWMLLPGNNGLPEDAEGTFYGWHVQTEWEYVDQEPEAPVALSVGDRVRQIGIGSLATITHVYAATDAQSLRYGVQWEGITGLTSVIDATAVELVTDDAASSEPETPVTFTLDDIDQARREGRAAAEREFQAWKESATEVAHQYANDNSLCGEFDRCMEEIGLPTRVRDREYEVTVRVRVEAPARAGDAPDRDDIRESVRNAIGYAYNGDWTVEDVDTGDEVDSW